jgi:hypothetical protein
MYQSHGSRRVISGWIAILAMLLNALLPSASMALANAPSGVAMGQSDWIEVCSVQGSTWVRLGPDDSPIEQTDRKPLDAPASIHGEHCLYCLTHAASFALPPTPALVLSVLPLPADLRPNCKPLAQIHVAWRAPAARAPPKTFI